MGLFDGFRLWNEKVRLERSRVRLLREAVQAGADRMKKSLRDPDESDWLALGTSQYRGLDDVDAQTMRDQAVRLYYRDPIARNAIRLYEKYVAGRGFFVSHEVTKKELPQLWEWWKLFVKRNKFWIRSKEVVRRGMRDGEVFVRIFHDSVGIPLLRFMDPSRIKSPTQKSSNRGNDSNGIVTDPEDIEAVLGYWYDETWIPAEEVIARKILVDSDVKRGRSILEVVMPRLAMYGKWLMDRMKLNYIRSLIGMSRKVKGSPAQAENLAAGYETSKVTAPDRSAYHKVPEGVSVVTHNEGVEYGFMTPNLQAADVQHDGRTLLLTIAAGLGYPEYMLTSDASNANFSSTLVAEAPGVMEFQDWQDFWRDFFEEVYERVILAGIRVGKIPEEYQTEEAQQSTGEEEVTDPITGKTSTKRARTIEYAMVRKPTPTTCDIQYPEVVHREVYQETQALALQAAQGWISKHTAAARVNLNLDDELEIMGREKDLEEEDEPEEDPMAGDPAEQAYRKGREDAIAGRDQKKPDSSKDEE